MADKEEECWKKCRDLKAADSSKDLSRSRKRSQNSDNGSESTRSSHRSSSPVRKKSRPSSKSKKKRKHSSSSESSSSSASSDSVTEKRKHKKTKKKKGKKEERKKSKKKKDKSKKKEKKSNYAVNQRKFGKYGILMESDLYNKQQEFNLWLQEVKSINPEVLPRFEMKKMFETFAEDYNTVTLPHKKFYDLEKWEAKQRAKGRMKALKKAQKPKVSIEDDELRHKSLHMAQNKSGMSKADLLEMQRIVRERQQEDYKKKAGMKCDESKGVRYQTIL